MYATKVSLGTSIAKIIDELPECKGFSLVSAVLSITAAVWIPSAAIWYLIGALFPGPTGPSIFDTPRFAILGALLLAPLLETLMMLGFFRVFGRIIFSQRWLLLLSTICWGAFHVYSPSWGLHAAWGFFVMGKVFLSASRRSSDFAVLIVVAVHLLANVLSYGATAIAKTI
ncbi:MAG: hypothetical protein HYV95_16025 [Opitutae bacterium]|nr:hypothetical protein [Opitutae bacterium]